jgi:large subunit ribosomal protein L4
MLKQPWTMRPFKTNYPIEMPLFDFSSGKFTGEIATLDPMTFNLPLRRDVVHKVDHYFKMKGKKVFKTTKTSGTTAGSGIKPTP